MRRNTASLFGKRRHEYTTITGVCVNAESEFAIKITASLDNCEDMDRDDLVEFMLDGVWIPKRFASYGGDKSNATLSVQRWIVTENKSFKPRKSLV